MDTSAALLLGGACATGLYIAWSIGANDVANSMASAVGARAITFKQAVMIAGVLEFAGALFVGSHVTETVSKGIVNVSYIDPNILLLGFFASTIAAAIWVTISTWKEMPISTTHSIVGAIIGFGFIVGGSSAVAWDKVSQIAVSWILSPIIGCILSFLVFKLIVRSIFAKDRPVRAARVVGPVIFCFTALIIVSSLLLKTPLGKTYNISDTDGIVIALIAAFITGIAGLIALRKVKEKGPEDYATVERIFQKLQVGTSCYVAFAHGANDVANAIGPVAAILSISQSSTIATHVEIPYWLLALGGFGLALGCLTWGKKVMKTLGERITMLTNTRGFSIDFGAATTVLLASKLGLPISTSHTVVGAVVGVGLARGLEAVNLNIVKKIIVSWLLTLPIASLTSVGIFLLLRFVTGI